MTMSRWKVMAGVLGVWTFLRFRKERPAMRSRIPLP